jgi:hypothetical protein
MVAEFAGSILIEWFEKNQASLLSRGIIIEKIWKDPEATWIEPSAMIELESTNFLALLEITRFGIMTFYVLPKDDSQIQPDPQSRLILEPAAIAYRKKYDISREPNAHIWQPEIVIHNVDDYTDVLESMLQQIITNQL